MLYNTCVTVAKNRFISFVTVYRNYAFGIFKDFGQIPFGSLSVTVQHFGCDFPWVNLPWVNLPWVNSNSTRIYTFFIRISKF